MVTQTKTCTFKFIVKKQSVCTEMRANRVAAPKNSCNSYSTIYKKGVTGSFPDTIIS